MAKHPRFLSSKRAGSYPDRDLDCQMAMEDVFQSVAEYGEAAGWTEREVAEALIELAHNRWFMLNAKEKMFEEGAGAIIRKAKAPLH
ncbi:hypothetical protein IB267_18500 [Ensifer sp. ENS09]|uniref:hypothetical protein n=1 Tax=Ensifer sp. ENS09 TaxID=2769263 RepID=UPI00177F59E4|nr:hypothetical protein [Ensifer sp. ENS09]MBD9650335.1 hypothetical protein [Ensifer sp. ENS09]